MESNVIPTKPTGKNVENATARFDWNRPDKPYEFYHGNNVSIDYTDDLIQIVVTYAEHRFWLAVSIPNDYADGQYQVINSRESSKGKKGIVIGRVLGQEFFSSDHTGSISFQRNEKFTITFSALHNKGYTLLNGFIEFDYKAP